jgi:hypothetical protein
MSKLVAVFNDRRTAKIACGLLTGKGCEDGHLALLEPSDDDGPRPALRHRGEAMAREAVRWGILGALIVEVPFVVLLTVLTLDVNIRVFMAATVWKIGAAFGAWLGSMAAQETGLDAEVAEYYEDHLRDGRWVLCVNVPRKMKPGARGVMIESDAIEVRDVVGSLEIKPSKAPRAIPRY